MCLVGNKTRCAVLGAGLSLISAPADRVTAREFLGLLRLKDTHLLRIFVQAFEEAEMPERMQSSPSVSGQLYTF